jgi:DmsE family decaheme c-type cytochrome
MHTFRSDQRFATYLAALALVMVIACGMALAGDQPKAAPSAVPSEKYVGSDTCASCHEDLAKGIAQSAHYKIKFQSMRNVEGSGCESCHGPGAAHVEGGGDVTKIISFKKLNSKKASERCLACHESNHETRNFARSEHNSNSVGCTDCHSAHHAVEKQALLKQKSQDLCFSCHTEMKAEFSKPFHHRVNEGLVQCSDCHNQHGSNATKQLKNTSAGDAVCFKCHTEKRGPFVHEHSPVKTEGCSSCHTPHGSTNARLLRVNQINLLCLQCHGPIATQGSAPGANTLQASTHAFPAPTIHNNAVKYNACTMCHSAIHGSNADPRFFR